MLNKAHLLSLSIYPASDNSGYVNSFSEFEYHLINITIITNLSTPSSYISFFINIELG